MTGAPPRAADTGSTTYRVLRADRAAQGCPQPGTLVYPGCDAYGCASDETRTSGVEHIACSVNASGVPFFTIPREDVGEIGEIAAERPRPESHAPDTELYSVCQFFKNGSYEYVRCLVGPEEAARAAAHYSSSVGAQLGTTRRVIIIDLLDCVNWEWRFGEGVVFPPNASEALTHGR